MEEQNKRKRPSFRQQARKKPKGKDDAPEGSFSGFGARMLQKLGHTPGRGLGAQGNEGIVQPIEVVLRNTKAGLGSQKEKSAQQIRDERRKAEANGEKYEGDSSEEERVRRKKKAPPTTAPRPKKTVAATFRDAGLEIPSTLQSIMDMSGRESKSTETATLSLRLQAGDVPFETGMSARARRELEAFGDAVEAVGSDSKQIDLEMQALETEIQTLQKEMEDGRLVMSRLSELRETKSWPALVKGLQELQAAYPSKRSREAIAILHPLFKHAMETWDPSRESLEELVDSLETLRPIINPGLSETYELQSAQRTTPYQTMMLSWWTTFHSAIIDIDVDGLSASALIHVLEVWRPVLPSFVFQRATKAVSQKVSATLQQWNPRKSIKRNSERSHQAGAIHSSSPLPQWVFQWLPYLPSNFFSEVKGKLVTVLHAWPIHRGEIPGIRLWKELNPEMDQLLVKHFLPRLSSYLKNEFTLDPSDQKLDAIEAVTSWCDVLGPRTIVEILHAEFFPMLFECAISWLTYADCVFEEVGQWMTYWRTDVFPKEIQKQPLYESDWEAAYKLVNSALDLDPEERHTLTLPAAEPVRAKSPQTPNFSKFINTEPPKSARQVVEETSFKDIVESWCADENLLLIPLRKADERTGFPLFRITASATGKGGVVTYFKGDVLYAQNKKDKGVWDPVGLDEGLVQRAEGK
jgi:tuftelin-interacting protein 11